LPKRTSAHSAWGGTFVVFSRRNADTAACVCCVVRQREDTGH
jgi:hypothetical protein